MPSILILDQLRRDEGVTPDVYSGCGVALLNHAPGDPVAMRAIGRMLGQWALGDPDIDSLGTEPLDAVADIRQALAEVA